MTVPPGQQRAAAVSQGTHHGGGWLSVARLAGRAQRTRHGQVEDHAKASWRTRAGAMGGGSTASFRCLRIIWITSPCVMAAMIRSVPR
jgi:hypothetical protein